MAINSSIVYLCDINRKHVQRYSRSFYISDYYKYKIVFISSFIRIQTPPCNFLSFRKAFTIDRLLLNRLIVTRQHNVQYIIVV